MAMGQNQTSAVHVGKAPGSTATVCGPAWSHRDTMSSGADWRSERCHVALGSLPRRPRKLVSGRVEGQGWLADQAFHLGYPWIMRVDDD